MTSDEPKSAPTDGSSSLTRLFRTASGAEYAQDSGGRIYRNGQPEADGPLIAVAVPQSPDGDVALGCRVFLLMDDGPQDHWRLTTAITELFARPVLPQLPDGWRWDLGDLLALIRGATRGTDR